MITTIRFSPRRPSAVWWPVAALLALVISSLLVPADLALRADPLSALLPPSSTHLFGTDELGRDVATRVLAGAAPSLFIGVTATALGVSVGILLGVTAGLARGAVDGLIARGLDALAAFPGILLCFVLIAITGTGMANLILAMGISMIPRFARLIRAQTQVVRTSGYLDQALISGASWGDRVARHVIPNVFGAVPTLAALGVGQAILAASTLSFLGLGVQPPSPDWGAMLAASRPYMNSAWWLSIFPGLALVSTVVALVGIGKFAAAAPSDARSARGPRTPADSDSDSELAPTRSTTP